MRYLNHYLLDAKYKLEQKNRTLFGMEKLQRHNMELKLFILKMEKAKLQMT